MVLLVISGDRLVCGRRHGAKTTRTTLAVGRGDDWRFLQGVWCFVVMLVNCGGCLVCGPGLRMGLGMCIGIGIGAMVKVFLTGEGLGVVGKGLAPCHP